MIIFFEPNTNPSNLAQLQLHLKQQGFESNYISSENCCIVPGLKQTTSLQQFTFITRLQQIDTAYQLASKEFKAEIQFEVNGILMGTHFANIIAGPCSVESEEQIFETAAFLSKNGIRFMRGGAYKPRTSPYSFRGLGKEGLRLMGQAAKQYNLSIVTELMDLSLLDEVMQYTDIVQIGSRNMANFYLLAELGKINKPVMLKRGMQAKVNEWLLAADYILSGGNKNVILCERGIRSFDPMSRNVMDIAVIPLVQSLSHLPVIADPSHGTGSASLVPALSMAAMVAGANGLMIEIHPNPAKALSDAHQAMTFEGFEKLLKDINRLQPFIQKPIDVNLSVV
ncbi:MAG: 3-deoxy-7-phosphoheptulonate synthase [Bacteroidia bacterium]|nr:3-deoxy-7-phosphoheptulonate synthase [Bacteroidia bacterium]